MAGQLLIELHPGAGQPEVREVRQVRPWHEQVLAIGSGQLPAVDLETLVAVEAIGLADVHAQLDQGTHRPRGQAVAADLVPGKGCLLQDDDIESALGQVGRGGRPSGTSTNHDDISSALDSTAFDVVGWPGGRSLRHLFS